MIAPALALLALAPLALAHDATPGARRRSLGGLHGGASALARRAAFRSERERAPVLSTVQAGACNFTHSASGYWEACGGAAGNLGSFSRLTAAAAQDACCASGAACAGFSFECNDATCATGSGFYKRNLDCGFVASAVQGFAKPSALPAVPNVTTPGA